MELSFHYLTDVVSMAVGVYLYWHSRTEDTVSKDLRMNILLGAALGALLGSRLIAALENPALFIDAPSLLYYYANKTIIGGIAGGIIGVEIAKKFSGITAWTGDRVVVPLIVAIIIGRIGCFVTGVSDGTVGQPCDYFFCLDQGDGVLRHPNSLYEIGFLLIFLLFYHYRKSGVGFISQTPGAWFRLLIISYFGFRFFIEFLKETQPLLIGLNSIQWTCLLFVLWYIRDLYLVHHARKETNSLLG